MELMFCRDYVGDHLAERIQILIDHGVKVDALDGKGWNALHYLCSREKTFIERKGGSFMEAGWLLRKNGIGGGVYGIKPEGLSDHAFVIYGVFFLHR